MRTTPPPAPATPAPLDDAYAGIAPVHEPVQGEHLGLAQTMLRPAPTLDPHGQPPRDRPATPGPEHHPSQPVPAGPRRRRTMRHTWGALAVAVAVLVCGSPMILVGESARTPPAPTADTSPRHGVQALEAPAEETIRLEHVWPTQGIEPAMVQISWERSEDLDPRDDVHLTWVDLGENYAYWPQEHAAEGRSLITLQVPHGGFDPCFELQVVSVDGTAGTASPRQCIGREELT